MNDNKVNNFWQLMPMIHKFMETGQKKSGRIMPIPDSDMFIEDGSRGWSYIGDNKRVDILPLIMTEPGTRLSDEQLIKIAKIDIDFGNLVRGMIFNENNIPYEHPPQKPVVKFYDTRDFRVLYKRYAYKYVEKHVWDNFCSKGIFRLGSLSYYRDLEYNNSVSGDRNEGFSVCVFDVGRSDFLCHVRTGYNQRIFSMTETPNDNSNLLKFGSKIIRIEIEPFRNIISNNIGARSDVRRVKYSDFKIVRIPKILDILSGGDIILNKNIAEFIREQAYKPSIFIKPYRFNEENEIRICFEVPSNVDGFFDIQCPELLEYVTLC